MNMLDAIAAGEREIIIAQGMELGVQGTPMWFLNGWRQLGAREPEVLEAMFNQRLRADAEGK